MKKINLLLIISILFTASCSSDTDSAAEKTEAVVVETKAPVTQKKTKNISSLWELETMNGKKVSQKEVFLHVKMYDATFDGNSFCNKIFGNMVMAEGFKLKFTEVGSTMMACDAATMSQEELYLSNLSKVVSFKTGNKDLSLIDENGTTLLFYSFNRSVNEEYLHELEN